MARPTRHPMAVAGTTTFCWKDFKATSCSPEAGLTALYAVSPSRLDVRPPCRKAAPRSRIRSKNFPDASVPLVALVAAALPLIALVADALACAFAFAFASLMRSAAASAGSVAPAIAFAITPGCSSPLLVSRTVPPCEWAVHTRPRLS